jgi:hypothetical protein
VETHGGDHDDFGRRCRYSGEKGTDLVSPHKWCQHSGADELFGFLGIKKEWIRDRDEIPHFEIVSELRKKAIKLGARQASTREIIQAARKLVAIKNEFSKNQNHNLFGSNEMKSLWNLSTFPWARRGLKAVQMSDSGGA